MTPTLSTFARGLTAETAFDVLAVARKFMAAGKDVIALQIGDSPYPSATSAIIAGNERPPSPNTLSSIWNFGGATAEVDAAETAFGDRSMPWMVSIDSIWESPDHDAVNIAWTRAFWERLQRYSDRGRIYLNFAGHGEDNDELTRRAFGPNYERLAAIKRRYDPENMFRFNQNIQPAT